MDTVPPHTEVAEETTIDVEQAFLGILLCHSDWIERVPFITKDHFRDDLHAEIFAIIKQASNDGYGCPPAVLTAKLGNHKEYISSLFTGLIGTANFLDYARQLQEDYQRRRMRELSDEMAQGSYSSDISAESRRLQRELETLSENEPGKRQFHGPQEILNKQFMRIEDILKGRIKPVKTGYKFLDNLLSINRGNLVVIGGRTGHGKTALAINMAHNMLIEGQRVLFFSMEMPVEEIANRMVSVASGVPYYNFAHPHTGNIESLVRAKSSTEKFHFYVHDGAKLKTVEVAEYIRECGRRGKVDCVFIDYLGLMKADDEKRGRVEQLEQITTDLKDIAKKLDVPVILLAQLNRALEGREDKTPTLSDLRGSGSIEQDADAVIFVHRPEVYLKDEIEQNPGESEERFTKRSIQHETDLQNWRGRAKIIIAKNRHGKSGDSTLSFNGETMTFGEG